MIHFKLIFVFLLFKVQLLNAQTLERYNSFRYSVNEGLLQSTMHDMAFDRNNFCWISFPNGIQKFDGKNFIIVPVQPGLPDDKWVRFFTSKKGDLFISHSGGISKYEIGADRFVQVYHQQPSVKTPVYFIGEDDNIIYLYNEKAAILELDSRTFKMLSQSPTGLIPFTSPLYRYFTVSNSIVDHKAGLYMNSAFYLWDLKKRKFIRRSDSIPGVYGHFLSLSADTSVLHFSYDGIWSLRRYHFSSQVSNTIFKKEKLDKQQAFRGVTQTWGNKKLLSFYNRLYEMDTTLSTIKSELVDYQNQPLAGISSISRIKEDNFGNLYICTINDGFRKILRNNYPIKYFGTGIKGENYILTLLPDKINNRILAGTYSNGLLVFDTSQRLIKHFKNLPGKKTSFSTGVILKENNGDYLLFNLGDNTVWRLDKNLSGFTAINIRKLLPEDASGFNYFSKVVFQNQKEAIIISGKKIYRFNFFPKSISESSVAKGHPMSGLFINNSIITHVNDELIFIDPVTFKAKRKIEFKNTGEVRCFAKDQANNIYLGSNKGIFKIDTSGKILLHFTKENGLPDECIYAIAIDDQGSLWCSTNRGVIRINKDKSILQLTKNNGLQENEFNTNAVSQTGDGELFFGGVNGISSFYPSAISGFKEKINILFTNIKINNEAHIKDTASWNIRDIDLPYHQNAVSFDFIAMGTNNPDQYIYQYKMEGIDEQWIQNNNLQTVRYFLPPGKYVFKVYASRAYNKEAVPMKEIHILIHPPFWKTWWFITALSLLMLTLLTFGINRYNKRQFQKKVILLEGEHKLTMERERISRDLHDSLGAYANAVLYNTELLEGEENEKERVELIKDLRFASKDIITALRETIWALKKDTYTAEECLLRIRNFIQPFASYYKQINFKVEGEAPASKSFPHNKAFNLVRIVQEAVSNSIKHAQAKNIFIHSSFENAEWKIVIKDDGNSFNYAATKEAQSGNGLNNMEHRAADAGFQFVIHSEKNKGTSITIIDSKKG